MSPEIKGNIADAGLSCNQLTAQVLNFAQSRGLIRSVICDSKNDFWPSGFKVVRKHHQLTASLPDGFVCAIIFSLACEDASPCWRAPQSHNSRVFMVDKRHAGRPSLLSISACSTLMRFWIARGGRDRRSIYSAVFNPWWRCCGGSAVDVSVEEATTCSVRLQRARVWFLVPLPQTGEVDSFRTLHSLWLQNGKHGTSRYSQYGRMWDLARRNSPMCCAFCHQCT